MKRSIGAIVAGLVFTVAGSLLVDFVLYALGVYPAEQPLDDRLAALATAYRVVIGVAGAWLTARLAPARPMQHAMILGFIGVVLGLAGVVVAIKKPELGPLWYPIGLALLAIPQCWAGGKLYEAQTGR
jgi:hypothetical protein